MKSSSLRSMISSWESDAGDAIEFFLESWTRSQVKLAAHRDHGCPTLVADL